MIWFPTYTVDFSGRFTFENSREMPATLIVTFPLQSENALYDGFEVSGQDGKPSQRGFGRRGGMARADRCETASAISALSLARQLELQIRNRRTHPPDQRLQAHDRYGFPDVDFPAGSLSPTTHQALGEGWHGEWQFKTLLTSAPIGVTMPEKLNPGPLASRITFFAPIGLLFFFFVVAILGAHREKPIHPLNYFMIGCAFFGFHLLFSYLVDHAPVLLSFALAAVVSVALVVSYARLFVGWRFALREIGISQLVYLVLFSFTFFFQGYTGLTITVGAILTLFLMMQLTGGKRWGLPDGRDGGRRASLGLADEPSQGRRCVAPYRCPPAEIAPRPRLSPMGYNPERWLRTAPNASTSRRRFIGQSSIPRRRSAAHFR